MSTKPSARRKAAKKPSTLPIEADERHQADVDFIARNRDALNASIRGSRKEIDRGVQSERSIDQIIADGRRDLGKI